MNTNGNANFKKICLVSLESKKTISFTYISEFCREFAKFGYYFDKVSRVAYDDSDGIVQTFNDCKKNYGCTIILCPKTMGATIKDFLAKLYGGQFSPMNVLSAGGGGVAIYYSDGENRLNFSDFKQMLDARYGVSYDKFYVKTVGAPRDLIESVLIKADNIFASSHTCGELYFNTEYAFDECKLEVVYSSETPKMVADEVQRCIISCLNDYVYALEDVSLAEQIFRLLKLRRMKISVAESFTGGGVGKKLVEVSGISEVYLEGLNTYSNDSKMQRLGVPESVLRQYGAVSAETAYHMALGLLNRNGCEVAVSTTGIAGPKSDNTSKPVGLAFIGVGVGDDVSVYKFNFTGDRKNITNCAINRALFLVYKKLK